MTKLSLGETYEEKKSTYEALIQNAEKWGRVCRIVGLVIAIYISLMLLANVTDGFLACLIVAAISIVVTPIFYYWYGQVLYYGFLFVKTFFQKKDIGTAEVAGAVGTSVLVSYLIGGRKGAKAVGVAWIVILCIAVTIGVYAGLYYFVKFWKEAYDLGIERDFKSRFLESIPFLNKKLNNTAN